MKHYTNCNWEKTTNTECEYRDTHHYCPHPEHACNCKDLEAHPMHKVDRNEDGKETVTTKHEDGRQDVQVKVTRLNIENRTPEDDIAEEKIIDAMSKKIVRVVVIHKPTNDFASFSSPLPFVRQRAEEVVKAHTEKRVRVEGAFEETIKDYCIVEFDADQVRVTSL